jgi:hypothetical protein
MRKIALLTIIFVLFSISLSNCENKDSPKGLFINSTLNAEIVKFVPEKCVCCWGWKIKVGDQFIMADSLPNIAAIGYTINNPIPVIIETGKIKINCGKSPNYYEIKTLTIK